jgi:tRNA(fMet)-specific endonuclease VapC
MRYLLDTNTVSYYLRGVAETVRHVQDQKPSSLAISAITAMELTYGVERRASKSLSVAVQGLLSGLQVLAFDLAATRQAGLIRAASERSTVQLCPADSQIAGHGLALELTLVTTDAIFKRVRGLVVQDWS